MARLVVAVDENYYFHIVGEEGFDLIYEVTVELAGNVVVVSF